MNKSKWWRLFSTDTFLPSHAFPILLLLVMSNKKVPVGNRNMFAVSLTPWNPLKVLALVKMTTVLHLPVCLFHYNECTCVLAFLAEVNLRAKRSSSSRQFGWWTGPLSHLVSEAQHGLAHHSLMFLINQCQRPLMEPQLLLPVKQSMPHPCLLWQQCLHLL